MLPWKFYLNNESSIYFKVLPKINKIKLWSWITAWSYAICQSALTYILRVLWLWVFIIIMLNMSKNVLSIFLPKIREWEELCFNMQRTDLKRVLKDYKGEK